MMEMLAAPFLFLFLRSNRWAFSCGRWAVESGISRRRFCRCRFLVGLHQTLDGIASSLTTILVLSHDFDTSHSKLLIHSSVDSDDAVEFGFNLFLHRRAISEDLADFVIRNLKLCLVQTLLFYETILPNA